MAKATAPTLLHGKIGRLIYRVIDGQQYVQPAPDKRDLWHKERIASTTNTGYNLNLVEFSGAAATASKIYNGIHRYADEELGPIYRPYAQNVMIARLKSLIGEHRKTYWMNKTFTTEIHMRHIAKAFRGLDLSHPAPEGKLRPADSVRMHPIGPQHNPTAIRIDGLHIAAAAVNPSPNARLEFRIQIRQSRVEEMVHSPRTDTPHRWVTKEQALKLPEQPYINGGTYNWRSDLTDWAPVQVIPREGFTLDLPTWPDGAKFATAIHIEWREHKATGRRTVRHHKQGIARIVSIHGPAAAFADPSHSDRSQGSYKTATHHLLPKPILKGTLQKPIDWRKDPKAYFDSVLKKLRR